MDKFRLRASLIVLLAIVGFVAIVPITPLAHGSNLTFESVLNLSNNSNSCPTTCASLPRTAAVGSRVYVVWLNNTSGNSNLLFRVSNSNGTSFGPVIRITNSTTQGANKEAMVAVGSDVYIVWQQNLTLSGNSILFRASTNNGTSFGPIVNLTSNISGLSTSALPEIAAIANSVYVIWLATTSAHTPANEILFKSSTINGSNFATVTAIVLSSKAFGSALSPLSGPQISAMNTHVYTTWIDIANSGKPQTFFAASSNSGTSFGTPFSLSNTSTGETDYNQQVSVSKSSVYVVWTNETSATNLIDNTMFAASNNNGTSFGTALNFNKAAVVDANPQLAAAGNTVYVVWSDTTASGNTAVLYRASNNNGVSFGGILNMSKATSLSNQETISATGNNVYISWVQSGTTSDGVHFISSSDGGITFGNSTNLSMDTLSFNPTVTTAGSYAYLTWEDGTTGNGDIYFAPTIFDFSISNSGTVSVLQGASGSDKITLTLLSGSAQPTALLCSGGLPPGASCSFNLASNFPSSSSNLTISTQPSTPTGSYTITVTGTGGSVTHSTQFTLTVNPSQTVGGRVVQVDKYSLLVPYLFTALSLSIASGIMMLYYRRKNQ